MSTLLWTSMILFVVTGIIVTIAAIWGNAYTRSNPGKPMPWYISAMYLVALAFFIFALALGIYGITRVGSKCAPAPQSGYAQMAPGAIGYAAAQ